MADPFAPLKESKVIHIAKTAANGLLRAAIITAAISAACFFAGALVFAIGGPGITSFFATKSVFVAGAMTAKLGAIVGGMVGLYSGVRSAINERRDIELGIIDTDKDVHLKHLERGIIREREALKKKQKEEETEKEEREEVVKAGGEYQSYNQREDSPNNERLEKELRELEREYARDHHGADNTDKKPDGHYHRESHSHEDYYPPGAEEQHHHHGTESARQSNKKWADQPRNSSRGDHREHRGGRPPPRRQRERDRYSRGNGYADTGEYFSR